MACLVAAICTEMESDACHECVSLIEQYESLSTFPQCFHDGAALHSGETMIPEVLRPTRRSSTTSRVFVDLTEDDCSPICIPEASDVSTECSDLPALQDFDGTCESGSAFSCHVDIDEEDDDVYFSLHRQEAHAEPDPSIRQHRIHVDIDEEDDDRFLSVFGCETHLQQDAPSTDPSRTHNDTDAEGEDTSPHEHVLQIEVAPDKEVDSSLKKKPERETSKPSQKAVDLKRENEASSVFLRPVASDNVEDPCPLGGKAPGLLAHLRSGRAQGVRNHLARKLSTDGLH